MAVPPGLIHPVVLIFLPAAVFSHLTGGNVRAAYLLAIGLALAWDRARRRVRAHRWRLTLSAVATGSASERRSPA